MKILLVLFGVAYVMTAVYGIACVPGICNFQCRELKCAPPSEFVPNGGFCACCPACITYLNENERCPIQFFGGGPPTVVCRQGLECRNGVCSYPN